MQILLWMAVGAGAGWLSGKLMNRHGYGWLMDIVMGITGATVAGLVLSAMVTSRVAGIGLTTLVAVQGAIITTMLVAWASGKKRHAWASETVPEWRHSKREGENALSQSRETE